MANVLDIHLDKAAVLFGKIQAGEATEAEQASYNTAHTALSTLLAMTDNGVDPANLEDILKGRLEKANKRVEKARKKAEGEQRKVAIEALRGKVQAASSLSEAQAILPEIEALKGVITVTANGFDTSLKVPNRGGGSGKGRPSKDEPTGFVDSNGDAILGSFTAWVKGQAEADTFDAETVAKLQNSKGAWRTKAAMAKVLTEASLVALAPEPEDSDEDSSEASTDEDSSDES